MARIWILQQKVEKQHISGSGDAYITPNLFHIFACRIVFMQKLPETLAYGVVGTLLEDRNLNFASRCCFYGGKENELNSYWIEQSWAPNVLIQLHHNVKSEIEVLFSDPLLKLAHLDLHWAEESFELSPTHVSVNIHHMCW